MNSFTGTVAAIVLSVSGLSLGGSVQADSFSISISDPDTSFSLSVYDDGYYYHEVPVYVIRNYWPRPGVHYHHRHPHHSKHRHHKPDSYYGKHGHHKHHKHDRHYRKHGHPGQHHRRVHPPRRDGCVHRPGRAHLSRVIHPAGA